MTAHLQPVGPHPGVDVLLVGSLFWSSADAAADVLAYVRDDDVESPALRLLLSTLRALADAGRAHPPQLVLDELRRGGELSRTVAEQLAAATTSGADPTSAREYASAVVAEALRRRIESAGHALIQAAATAAEPDLAPLVAQAAAAAASCARRLAVLRGEST